MNSGAAATYEYELLVAGELMGTVVTQTSTTRTDEGEVRKIDSKVSIGTGQLSMIGFSFEAVTSFEIDDSGLQRYVNHMTIEGERIRVSASLENGALVVVALADGWSDTKRFPNRDYDLTSEETPGALLAEMGQERTVRILDVDKQEISKRTLEWVRDESLHVGRFSIPCKVVRFKDHDGKGMQWIGPDSHPLVLREQGEDDDGSYEFTIKSIR